MAGLPMGWWEFDRPDNRSCDALARCMWLFRRCHGSAFELIAVVIAGDGLHGASNLQDHTGRESRRSGFRVIPVALAPFCRPDAPSRMRVSASVGPVPGRRPGERIRTAICGSPNHEAGNPVHRPPGNQAI